LKFLVTGATGTVGGEVLKQLVSEGADVRAVTREASKADLPDGVELVEADLTVAEDVDRALSGIDRVFLNMADDDGAAFFAGAMKAQLDYVVLLSSFTAFVPLPSGDQNIVAVRHRAGEDGLAEAGLSFTALRAAGFDYNLLMWATELGEGVVRAPSVDVRLPKIDPRDIGASAAAVLLAPESRASHYTITGPEKISTREEVAIVGQLLGREIRVEELSVAEAAEIGFPEGTPDFVVRSVLETLGEGAAALDPTGDVQTLTARPARSFRD
jgi:uncharacterized protein YbjT (DUF2867 family)